MDHRLSLGLDFLNPSLMLLLESCLQGLSGMRLATSLACSPRDATLLLSSVLRYLELRYFAHKSLWIWYTLAQSTPTMLAAFPGFMKSSERRSATWRRFLASLTTIGALLGQRWPFFRGCRTKPPQLVSPIYLLISTGDSSLS